jgi:hypothetical protein
VVVSDGSDFRDTTQPSMDETIKSTMIMAHIIKPTVVLQLNRLNKGDNRSPKNSPAPLDLDDCDILKFCIGIRQRFCTH